MKHNEFGPKWHAGHVFGSFEMLFVAASSYLPLNGVVINSLRLLGARVGANNAINHGLQARRARSLVLGDDCYIAEQVILDARGGLRIGSHVSVNSGVQIWSAQHDWRSEDFAYEANSVSIGDHAWICSRAIVLPGSVIGDGVVVAAGAVVGGVVPPWTVVAGVPARWVADRPMVDSYILNARKHKMWWW